MSRYMNLTVIEVQGPDRILARETPGPTASAETVEYASFFKEMNDYFNNNILTFEVHSPKPNEICAAIHSHNKWHRVRVQTILSTMTGAKADCLFLDTGERQMVQLVKIQKIPKKFLKVPFQVKTFALYGLQPLSLVIDRSLKAFKRPCKKWDKSAANHIKKMINHASAIQAVIKSKGEENVLLAMIYLRFSGKKEIVSLNEDMINYGYAIKDPATIKSFDETNNFLPDVFQDKYVERVLSQKTEQSECSVYNLNGFHRKPRSKDCPVRVRLTSTSNISQVNSSDDDSGNRSSSSSGNPKNNYSVFSLEESSCADPKKCRKIPSNISSDTPFIPPDNQQMASRPSTLKQLLSYHRMLQQNNELERNSESLNSHSVSYQLQNLGKDSFPAESTSCNPELPASTLQSGSSCMTENSERFPDFEEKRKKSLNSHSVSYQLQNLGKDSFPAESTSCNPELPASTLQSGSSCMTENSERFHDFEEKRRKSISAVMSPKPNQELISKVSPIKSPQMSPAVSVSKLKTDSVLSDFLAYHRKISSCDQKSVPEVVTFKALDHSSNMSAKDEESSCTNDEKNKSENAFPIFDCQRTMSGKRPKKKSVHNDACDSKKKLSTCKLSEPVVCQSLLAQKSSPVTGDNLNNSSSSHRYEAKSDVPFSGIQTEPDVRPKRTVPVCNSPFAKSKDGKSKLSENLSSTSSSSSNDEYVSVNNRNSKETTPDSSSNSIRNHCHSEKTISSESQNSRSHQNNSSSNRTIPAMSKISVNAVNVLNNCVSSKLLSSSSCSPMKILQNLNTLTLNNLEKIENCGNSSASGISKNFQIFNSADESDYNQTDDKPCLGSASSSYSRKNSYENFKNGFEKLESQVRDVITSANSTSLSIPPPECLDRECTASSFTQEETLGFKSQTRSLQAHAATGNRNFVFEDKRKQKDLSWPKIETPAKINGITPDLKQDLPENDNTKTNKHGIDTFMDESKKKESDSSFKLLTDNNGARSPHLSSAAEICQETKRKDILPLIAPEDQERNPSARNSQTQIRSVESSSSNEQINVLSSDESKNCKQVEFLKPVELEKGNTNWFSSVDIANESDLKTRSYSTSSSSVAASKDVAFSTSVDIENTPIIFEDNPESSTILNSSLLNENLESPSTAMLSKPNDDAETLGLEYNRESILLSTPLGVTMPALIDDSIDSVSESTSPAKDSKTDSTSSSMTDLTDVTAETNFRPLSALSASPSSIIGPNDITESEALSEKDISDTITQHVPSLPQTTRDDYSISSLLSTNDENKEFEYVSSSDKVLLDNNPDSILPQTLSVPETSNGFNPLLPSVTDISEVSLPESVNSMLPSETTLDKLDETLIAEQCSLDQDENNDLCSDEPHTISNGNTESNSESPSKDNPQTTASDVQPISSGDIKPNTPLGSLSCQVSSEETNAKNDPTSSCEKSINVRELTMEHILARSSCKKSMNTRELAIERIMSRSILEKLGVSKKVNEENKSMEPLTTESILLNDSVLFVAEKIPNPIYNLKEFDVPEVLAQVIRNMAIKPKPIQAYSWGPAIRGKSVIGISPPDSGKTWAYLVPIFASLCQYNIYSDIKFSNGPIALILVQSWKKVISVYEQCKYVNQINKEIITEIGYGRGDDSKMTVKLMNGCHIFITTLPFFLRMLNSKYTNLDRLCHLVIDDADILLQDFYKEMVDLMCKYKSMVESRDKDYQRHQVMAFSSKWTNHIDGFVKNAIQDPVIVITDMIEAAVYGHVKQIPIMCEDSERNDQLVNLIPQIIKSGEKIIIFTLDHKCSELQSLLSQLLQKHVAMVCDSLYKSEWEIISKEWKFPLTEKESYRVLVCSDVVLCDMFINDATCIVHYQMPKKKIHIGLRTQTMSNYYQHYNKPSVKSAKSYILITPQDQEQVNSMRSFLMRTTDVADKKTWDFLTNLRQVEDLDPKKELCINIKAFGKCRNRHQCHNRHSVVPSVDLNGSCSQHICLPLQGDVRVKVLHVKTANNFYVRILEHQIGTHKSIQVHSDLATLIMGMAMYYSNPSNRKVLDDLKVGMLCAVNTGEHFSRVKVLQAYDNASKNTANLFFVDTGKEESHPIYNLYQLADEFKEVPFQAVEVFLCSLYPVDYDTDWTLFANSFADTWLDSKMLYGKIRFVMKNTLWLDPLLERTFLKAIKTVTNGPSLRKELIKNNFAINNPQHLIQLHKLFEGYVPKLMPTNTLPTNCSTWELNLENETLQTGDDYENVLISYIFNPEHFYVQKLDMKICLNDLMMKIQEKMSQETEPQQKREWFLGMHCLCKSSMDSRWYRVIILNLLDAKAVVHFVDYGNMEEVCIDELQTMPRELMYLPSQAIECRLAHIKSAEGCQWSAQCNDMMYYMSQTGDNVYKTLAVNVVSEMPTEGKMPQYCVNLLDTSYERVINIGQELVWWKMAAATDAHFKPLFSKPVTAKMFYPTAAKIAEMCAVLYYGQVSSQQYADLMMSYLKASFDHPEKLIEEDVPECFLKLLSYTHTLDVFSLIVDCIKLMVSIPSLFDNLLSSGILQSLGQILKTHDDDDMLQMTLQLIRFMTEINTSLINTIASCKSGLFSILCEIVKSVYPNEIRTSVCQLLESFCLADQTCTENLITLQVCPLFLPSVLEMEDHDFTEAYLSLLDPVSLLDIGLVEIKREKPIEEIMKIVEETKCEKCVYYCLVALKRLADNSRKNKTLLLEHNAVTIFSSCRNLLNGTEAATLCQELLDGLFVKVNQDNKVVACSQLQPINESNFQVLWCQNKFRLLITLKIKSSEWSGCEFQKTSILFRFVLNDGVTQSMKYELFDEVVVKKCAVCIQNNEVILSLCKAEVKYWPRLLQDKYNKPHNLFVDFDKIEDSDDSGSEEVEANEENLFTLEVVVKRPCLKLVKKPTDNEEENVPLPVDTANSDEDSLENSDFEEYDRFNIFNAKYANK